MCRCGGIGRRTWLKIKRVTPCRFESGQRHLIKRERIFHFRNVRSLFRWFCTETVSILTTAAILLLQQWIPLFSEAYFFMTVFLTNKKPVFLPVPVCFPSDSQGNLHHLRKGSLSLLSRKRLLFKNMIGNRQNTQSFLSCSCSIHIKSRAFHFRT